MIISMMGLMYIVFCIMILLYTELIICLMVYLQFQSLQGDSLRVCGRGPQGIQGQAKEVPGVRGSPGKLLLRLL